MAVGVWSVTGGIHAEIINRRKQVQPVSHTIYQRGVVIVAKEMTFTNRVCIDGARVCLNDLPAEERESIINELIYRPLTTIQNAEVRETA